MPNGARLWWVQHGSPQGIPQETAACTWPCETGRRCSSSGGIIIDSGSTVSESQQEAESVFSQSLCTTSSSYPSGSAPSGSSLSLGVYNSGPSSSGSSSGTYIPPSPGNIVPSSFSSSGSIGSSNGNTGATYSGAASSSANSGGK
jgi:hypothetical protein